MKKFIQLWNNNHKSSDCNYDIKEEKYEEHTITDCNICTVHYVEQLETCNKLSNTLLILDSNKPEYIGQIIREYKYDYDDDNGYEYLYIAKNITEWEKKEEIRIENENNSQNLPVNYNLFRILSGMGSAKSFN